MNTANPPRTLLTSCGGWHLPGTARAFAARGALAGLWISGKNRAGVPADQYRRCWPFHLAMKPFYCCAPQIWTERAFYAFFPLWRAWLNRQPWPECNVVQAIMGYATEPFDRAEKTGALQGRGLPEQPSGQLLRFLAARVRPLVSGRKGAHSAMDVRPDEPRTGAGGPDSLPLDVCARQP